MNKFTIVKLAVKAYFIAALYFSFSHITAACERFGATAVEAVAFTLMVDGFFVLGAIMRSPVFSSRSRSIGLWVQGGAGAVSLVGNVLAAQSAFGVLFGLLLPFFVVFTEWLSDARQMKTAATEAAELAAAEAERVVAEAAAKAEADRIEKNRKARSRNAQRRAEAEALDNLVNGAPKRRTRRPVGAAA